MASSSDPSPMPHRKQDLAWQHCQMIKAGERVHLKCIYCAKLFKGGGIYRFKEHLAGRKGGGPMCQQVPADIQLLMQQSLDGVLGKHIKQKKVTREEVAKFVLPYSNVGTSANPLDNLKQVRSERQKKDLAWQHCHHFKYGERVHIKCKYCEKMFKGGGIHRFKEHLAGRKGSAPICEKVPPDIRLQMEQALNETPQKPSKKQKLVHGGVNEILSPSSDINICGNLSDDANTGSKTTEACNSIDPNSNLFVNQEGNSNGNVDRRKSARNKTSHAIGDDIVPLNIVGSERVDNPLNMTLGRFLYDIGASLDFLDSAYFQPLANVITTGTSGVVAPTPNNFRGLILKCLAKEIRNDIEQHRKIWSRSGCSILVEEWISKSGKTLINFLVYCSKGKVFLKCVDVSHIMYSADGLYESIKQVVEEVGAEHVVQVITNGEKRYHVVGEKLMHTFPSLYWAPCATHCIDLILEDFGKLEWVSAVIEQAKSVTRYIYNHNVVLDLMKRFTRGNDIVLEGPTHSATNFTTLKKMAELKLSLQTMVTSQEWLDCPYSKEVGGLMILDTISSRSFWSSCILIIQLTSPLLRLLGIVGSEKRAAMGYVFAGIYRAKETIKKELVKREDYMVYWNIIDHRWGQQHHPPLHAAGFFLNPKFYYSIEGDKHNHIISKLFDCIERLVSSTELQDKIVKELNVYKSAVGDLGRKIAVRARETLLPAEWWNTYGGGCPNLALLAIRILSQTCSSIGCKRSLVPFEKLYETRNFLQRQRLSDLIFVQYNLRIRQMVDWSKSQIPMNFDEVNSLEDWIVPNELCLEDCGNSDWTSLFPTTVNSMPMQSSTDETENLDAGFDDFEIFNELKEVKWGNGDENVGY
ncbi:hypothetical protein K2173_009890 [Erythroxylum novogranatense]|uniref:BED-type domain-containing protein n=1 Tax=Erythroxylum novogranatense TaxID=1862640 RepID=A0AAV8T0H6_9ROSI|nr:hypothetical protein K2173_009890 [Erythroxylum novogranatense]